MSVDARAVVGRHGSSSISPSQLRDRDRRLLGVHADGRCDAHAGAVVFQPAGYSPVELALLFLLYEFFGIVTNLVGGWLASRIGVRFTLGLGLGLQVVRAGSARRLESRVGHGRIGRLT